VLKKGKRFFFEKKKQKLSFTASRGRDGARARRSESFFASFFSKKEALACFQPGGRKLVAVIDPTFRPVSITPLGLPVVSPVPPIAARSSTGRISIGAALGSPSQSGRQSALP